MFRLFGDVKSNVYLQQTLDPLAGSHDGGGEDGRERPRGRQPPEVQRHVRVRLEHLLAEAEAGETQGEDRSHAHQGSAHTWNGGRKKRADLKPTFFLGFGGILGSVSRAEFPVSLSNHAGFTPRLLYSSTHHSIWKLVELKMLDFSDRTRTGISILKSAGAQKTNH